MCLIFHYSSVHHVMDPVVRKSRYAGAHVQEEDVVMPTIQQPPKDDKRAVLDRIRVGLCCVAS